jgi:hypothetical protein
MVYDGASSLLSITQRNAEMSTDLKRDRDPPELRGHKNGVADIAG